ncbi:MAG: hypothetical protein RI924_1183 [Bacteroidota bacterium]
MNSRIYSLIKFLVLLSLSAGMLYWAFKGQDLSFIIHQLKNTRYQWLAASVFTCLLAHVVRALRWGLLIQPLGFTVSLKNSFSAVMIAYLANLAIPRMGEVSRCAVLNRTDKVPVNQLLGTVLTERFFDLLFLLAITGLSLILSFSRIAEFIYQNIWLKTKSTLLEVDLLGWPLVLLFSLFLLMYALKKTMQKWMKPVLNAWNGFKNGLLSFRKMPSKATFLILSALMWFLYFLSTYLCFFALAATSNLGLLAALAALVFGSLGMIVPVQGGIGAFHWMVAEGLTLYALPKADGLAFATLIHSSQILVILVIGSVCLLPVLLTKHPNEQSKPL